MRRPALRLRQVALGTAVLASAALITVPTAAAQVSDDCAGVLVPHSTVAGHAVGETTCLVTAQSSATDDTGHTWDREDLAIGGTTAGWADPTTVGNTRKDLTDAPNILFPQFGIPSWTAGVGTYTGGADGQGAGIDVLYPADPARWSGKTVVLVHGQGNNTPMGTLVPQPAGAGLPATTFDNLYADEWMNAGYAVIYTRRPAASGVPTVLDDAAHTRVDESVNDNLHMLLDLVGSGEAFLRNALHRNPSTVLWYGHSSGVIAGRLLNYSGLNDRPGGGHYVDGFLSDDPGGGLPLPLSMPQGGQVLGVHDGLATYPSSALLTAARRADVVPEFTLAHADYLDTHSWLPGVTYLTLKQQAEQLYQREGLTGRTTLQVVAGVSHHPNGTSSPAGTVDMGPLVQAVIPDLAAWVGAGTAPPAPTTGAPGDASIGHQVQLPEIACPQGVTYPWPGPDGAASETEFVPYDGTSLEPIDSRGALVDLDAAGVPDDHGDGVRGVMPTMTQVWRARGLLGSHQVLTGSVYVGCVQRVVDRLRQGRLLTAAGAATYVQQAAADARRARFSG